MMAERIKFHHIYVSRHIFLVVNRTKDDRAGQLLFAILLFLIAEILAVSLYLNWHGVRGKLEKVKIGKKAIITFSNIGPQSHSNMLERARSTKKISFLNMWHLRLMIFNDSTNLS